MDATAYVLQLPVVENGLLMIDDLHGFVIPDDEHVGGFGYVAFVVHKFGTYIFTFSDDQQDYEASCNCD